MSRDYARALVEMNVSGVPHMDLATDMMLEMVERQKDLPTEVRLAGLAPGDIIHVTTLEERTAEYRIERELSVRVSDDFGLLGMDKLDPEDREAPWGLMLGLAATSSDRTFLTPSMKIVLPGPPGSV